jgi:hypothetical protein
MAYQRSHKGALSNTIEGGKKSKKKLNKTGKGTSEANVSPAEQRRNNLNSIFTSKQMFQKKKKRTLSTCLWHHKLLVLMNRIFGSLTVTALVT